VIVATSVCDEKSKAPEDTWFLSETVLFVIPPLVVSKLAGHVALSF
jgi:hypothetical protein